MIKVKHILFGAALSLVAAPALAQTSVVGHGNPAKVANLSTLNAAQKENLWLSLSDYARCAIDVSPRNVRNYLATFPGSDSSRRMMVRLPEDRCLGTRYLEFHEIIFRGALYERLLRDTPAMLQANIALAPAIDYAASAGRQLTPAQTEAVGIYSFSDCAVRANPAAARALALSDVSSPEEDAAMSDLGPQLQNCLGTGTTVNFPKIILRAALLETLYRVSTAGTAASGTAN